MTMETHLKLAGIFVNVFYNQFSIGGFKIGLYPLFAIMPGMGDMISISLAVYLIWIAKQMNLPRGKLLQMYGNIIFDLTFGAIPIVGDLMDTVYRAHVRNLGIIQSYARTHIIEGQIVEPDKLSTN